MEVWLPESEVIKRKENNEALSYHFYHNFRITLLSRLFNFRIILNLNFQSQTKNVDQLLIIA